MGEYHIVGRALYDDLLHSPVTNKSLKQLHSAEAGIVMSPSLTKPQRRELLDLVRYMRTDVINKVGDLYV